MEVEIRLMRKKTLEKFKAEFEPLTKMMRDVLGEFERSDVLSLDACLSKCLCVVLKWALAWRLSIKMPFRYAQTRSRFTLVVPNAFLECWDALLFDACRSKRFSDTRRCALARRLSIQMLFWYAEMRSGSAPVNQNAFPICSDAFSLDACRPRCISGVLRCALARRLSIQTHLGVVSSRWSCIIFRHVELY